jgi:hypothetical protein
MIMRYALIPGSVSDTEDTITRYLPDNYKVDGLTSHGLVIAGRDVAGWTLDGYVIPRLASGVIYAEEIDLSHEAMKELPLTKREKPVTVTLQVTVRSIMPNLFVEHLLRRGWEQAQADGLSDELLSWEVVR